METLESFIEKTDDETRSCPHPINDAMIHHWRDAIGDRDANGELVGQMRFRLLKFRPAAGDQPVIGPRIPGGRSRPSRWAIASSSCSSTSWKRDSRPSIPDRRTRPTE
jgi:hypothetical protein